MSTLTPPKRPRLSLQIKSLTTGPGIRASRTLAAVTNPRSPTSFNTLTNVYSTAIDRSAVTPVPATDEPLTAIHMTDKRLPSLPRLQMPSALTRDRVAHTPYTATQFPETPLTAKPMSPAVAVEMRFPSTVTSTPPLSAGPLDAGTGPRHVFDFSPDDIQRHNQFSSGAGPSILVTEDTAIPDSSRASSVVASDGGSDTPFPSDRHASPPLPPRLSTATTPVTAIYRRRAAVPSLLVASRPAPYVRNRALHSILRNSPLPPSTAATPMSPRRQSQRLIDKANRHVMYNNPLTQTITTSRYTRSHVDLLCDDASPAAASASAASPPAAGSDADRVLDLTMAYTGNETRDGGTTPGPFEEMRRRMAGLGTSSAGNSAASPRSSSSSGGGGIRKRRSAKKDKKRRWVWTLGQDEEEEATLSGAMMALKAAQKAAASSSAALQTEMATEPAPVDVLSVSESSHDVEMQDWDSSVETAQATAVTATAVTATATSATATATATATTRKRKSTPTPYATDSESDAAGDDDAADFDMDMHTPTTAHLQGTWLRQAAASARHHSRLRSAYP